MEGMALRIVNRHHIEILLSAGIRCTRNVRSLANLGGLKPAKFARKSAFEPSYLHLISHGVQLLDVMYIRNGTRVGLSGSFYDHSLLAVYLSVHFFWFSNCGILLMSTGNLRCRPMLH